MVDSLESSKQRRRERLAELVEGLEESRLNQSELEEMAQNANDSVGYPLE